MWIITTLATKHDKKTLLHEATHRGQGEPAPMLLASFTFLSQAC
jgi:hypothetical protein